MSDFDYAIITSMFCIAGHRGIRKPNFPLIDDLKKSNINNTAQMSETYCPYRLDSFVASTWLEHMNGSTGAPQWSIYFPNV